VIQTEEPTRESAPHLDLSDRALIGDHLGVDGFPGTRAVEPNRKTGIVKRMMSPSFLDSMAFFLIQSKSV